MLQCSSAVYQLPGRSTKACQQIKVRPSALLTISSAGSTPHSVDWVRLHCTDLQLAADIEMPPITRFIHRDGVDLATYHWTGPCSAPAVLLVHGYPDNARVWTEVAENLSHDHQVFAYDVRGAGLSSRPRRTSAYALQELMRDQQAVIDALPVARPVHLVGHDWGGLQSWETVTETDAASRIASYTAISGPCLDHMGYWLRARLQKPSLRGCSQILRQATHSWYIGSFHLPGLKPLWRLAGDRGWFALQKRLESADLMQDNPAQLLDGDFGIQLYRANILQHVLHPRPRATKLPVQVLIPEREPFMIPEIWDGLEQWVADLQIRSLPGGHWCLLSHPQAVADAVRGLVSTAMNSRAKG